MSEKKGLKQSRLPFQIISTSPKVSSEHKASPLPAEKSSPKTPVTSRKRKPSNEGENIRSTKIGRTNSKENIIAEQDPIEILDSSDDNNDVNTTQNESIASNSETTPTITTATPQERKLRIKIQSCSKRKQVTKPLVVNPDDSIVYLDDEEIQNAMKNNKKSVKKSEKKKSTNNQKASNAKRRRVAKSLNLNQDDKQGIENANKIETKESDVEIMEVDDSKLVFDDDDNERSDVDSVANAKIAAVKDQLEKCMSKQLKECKQVSIVLEKISMPDNEEEKNGADEVCDSKSPEINTNQECNADIKDTSEIINEDEEKMDESKTDLDQSVKSSEKSMSESEESPKVESNKELMSEEISKLVDNSPQNDESAHKDLHDEFVEIFTDDEKKSPTNPNTPNISNTTPKLTPKALARRKDQEAKRIEKELQRQKEKEEKEKQRLKEKEMREEAKRKEREEKEEMRKREKDEREKKRLAELEKKEEEKRQKEEERKRLAEQKEEEKRAKEEERRQKEEERKRQNEAREEERKKKEMEKIKEEERKKKAAQAFSKFFVAAKKKSDPQIDDEVSKESAESPEVAIGNFMPFQIHGTMRLAPRVRSEISKQQKDLLDSILKSDGNDNDRSKLYLTQIKSSDYFPKTSTKTWPEEEEENKDDDVIVVDELEGVGEDIKEDEAHEKMKHRAKLLLFKENRRPAYYGTWRKKSKSISARRPFAQDAKFFDYEVDSDDEWEEEEPGESLHGSDSEKEKEKDDDDYEVDDDFFVPHGHLSEDEMQHDDEIMEDNSPETQKAKLKVLQQEFAAEMKKKTEKIKPRLIGCIWMNGDEDEDGGSKFGNLETKYHCSDIIWRILKAREMFSSGEEIKMESFEPEIIESEEDNNSEEKPSAKQQKTPAQIKVRVKLEGDSVKELIKLIHYNTNSKKFLIKEYQAYRLKNYHKLADFQEFQVKSVDEKINEISVYKTCPEEGPLFGKKCWCVKEEVIKEYFGDEKLPLTNQWTYILEKEKKPKPNTNGGDSKKGSREVTPTDEKSTVNEAPQVTEPPKVIPESPKPSNSFKITNFAKSSPKTPSVTAPKVAQSPKLSASTVQTKPTANASPKVQSSSSSTATNSANSGKKRVAILMSVQRGQSINQEKKNQLINQYLQTNQKKDAQPLNDNEIIEID